MLGILIPNEIDRGNFGERKIMYIYTILPRELQETIYRNRNSSYPLFINNQIIEFFSWEFNSFKWKLAKGSDISSFHE